MENQAKVFKYERPEFDGVKKSMLMCDEPLEIIRVAARDQNTENKRVNMAALKPWMVESNRFES